MFGHLSFVTFLGYQLLLQCTTSTGVGRFYRELFHVWINVWIYGHPSNAVEKEILYTRVHYNPVHSATESVRQRNKEGTGALAAEALKRNYAQILNSKNGRLGFCDKNVVASLTVDHFKMLEEKYRELGCWKSKLSNLFARLYREEKFGLHYEYPSASQGDRLRCRLLFRFDTCRTLFIKSRAAYHPDVDTDWPEPVLKAMDEGFAMEDSEDYDNYYNNAIYEY